MLLCPVLGDTVALAGLLVPEGFLGLGLAPQDHRNRGLPKDLRIDPETALLDVSELQLDLVRTDFLEVVALGIRAPGEDGALVGVPEARPVGDARTHAEDLLLALGVHVGVVAHLGTGPDEAHLAAQDVEELWQLVELELAQELSDPRDAWIAVRGRRSAELLGVDDHGPKLEDPEVPSAETDS